MLLIFLPLDTKGKLARVSFPVTRKVSLSFHIFHLQEAINRTMTLLRDNGGTVEQFWVISHRWRVLSFYPRYFQKALNCNFWPELLIKRCTNNNPVSLNHRTKRHFPLRLPSSARGMDRIRLIWFTYELYNMPCRILWTDYVCMFV